MTSTDFSNLIRKLSALDNQACQEVAVTAVKQAGVMVQSQARLLISSDTGALARSVKVKNEVKENKATATVYTNSAYAPYYEFGTGPNGEANHQGISPQVSPKYKQTGWMIPADAMTVDKAEMLLIKMVKSLATIPKVKWQGLLCIQRCMIRKIPLIKILKSYLKIK